ncbi:hypothetical protein EYF80_023944 [Liparis tanakae]|uniref:Secreted protein n=1 Tax=Liparis tanakae TaxID=230148 RepID=A0A4Z2HLY0_9TELE|nr:hypothetical protein EYF80_023944 [Liparis tanakae]
MMTPMMMMMKMLMMMLMMMMHLQKKNIEILKSVRLFWLDTIHNMCYRRGLRSMGPYLMALWPYNNTGSIMP